MSGLEKESDGLTLPSSSPLKQKILIEIRVQQRDEQIYTKGNNIGKIKTSENTKESPKRKNYDCISVESTI